MKSQVLTPDRNYLHKQRVIFSLLALLIFAVSLLFAFLLSLDRGIDAGEAGTVAGVLIGVDVLFWLIAMAFTGVRHFRH